MPTADNDSAAHAQRFAEVLAAARILIGEDDIKLERQPDAALTQLDLVTLRLQQRLRRAYDACRTLGSAARLTEDGASPAEVQAATGTAAMCLLVELHQSELHCIQHGSSSSSAKPQVDPALAQPSRKLVSLVSQWCFGRALSRFDASYAQAQPSSGRDASSQGRFAELLGGDVAAAASAQAGRQLDLVYDSLRTILSAVSTVLPEAQEGPPRILIQSQAGRILLEQCASDVLDIGLRLAKAPSTTHARDAEVASGYVGLILRTSSAISSLAGVGRLKARLNYASHSKASLKKAQDPAPAYALQLATRLSSLQLLRPDGVEALLRSSLDDAESRPEVAQRIASYSNLSALSSALTQAPIGVPEEVFLKTVLQQMMAFLQDHAAPAGSNASPQLTVIVLAFSRLSRRQPELLREALDARIYQKLNGSEAIHSGLEVGQIAVPSHAVRLAVRMLRCIIEHAEPSSDFIEYLFKPILGPCLALLSHLSRPVAQTCLAAWVRLVQAADIADQLGPQPGSVLDQLSQGRVFGTNDASASLTWADDDAGVCLKTGSPQSDMLSSMLQSLPAALASSVSLSDATELKLPPSLASSFIIRPVTVVAMLQDAHRADAAKLLLQKMLDSYVTVRLGSGLEAADLDSHGSSQSELRSILYLQMIMQLFDSFGEVLLKGDARSTLSFIDYTLTPPVDGQAQRHARGSSVKMEQSITGLAGLLNIEKSQESQSVSSDNPELASDPEVITTALSDATLSFEKAPMLAVIEAKISPLLNSTDEEVRRLGQEAMLVLKARESAGRSASPMGKIPASVASTPRSKGLDKYQEALKLLQDPILPVRAHGLVMLRELVTKPEFKPTKHSSSAGSKKVLISDASDASRLSAPTPPIDDKDDICAEVDPALHPAILDIFVQAIQDEESYLYLNAVQGLAAMAISGGTQVLKVLVSKYVGAEERRDRNVGQAEADRRLRIGEALLRVLQRCGQRLGPNVSLVVEPLLTMLRDAREPAALRSSAISLLGTCVEAAPLEMASGGFSSSLGTTCLDLVSLESTERTQPLSALKRRKRKQEGSATVTIKGSGAFAGLDTEALDGSDEEEETPQPDSALATDTKLPQLRRSALFLLALLLAGANAVLENCLDEASAVTEDGVISSVGRDGNSGISALRLPGGAILPPLPSDKAGTSARRSTTLPPLLFDSKLLGRAKTVLRFVGERDADAVVRVQADEAQQQCAQLELNLVHLAQLRS
ncbi:hypothetical protein OC842_001992 [Tilletia horrida]|uniref:RNA polymerase II assembly factor Rtp1 C-terminal domain-containing protein n=1 Tax=Tilletia horrida TaxID=155126 RepID=A0AAN6GFA8_9BASI|nr:hypothetical protein OC842_001992 [Tilletia horrida]